MCSMCASTVRLEMTSRPAISRLGSPSAGRGIYARYRGSAHRHQQQEDVVAAAVTDVLVQPGDQDVEQGSAVRAGAADRVRGDLGQREEPAVRVPGLGDAVGVEQQLV